MPSLAKLLTLPDVLVCAVVTQPDRPAGRGNKIQVSAVKELARRHDIPVLQPESIRATQQEFFTAVGSFGRVDAAVVVSFGQILPATVLEWPLAGCINVHASLLPRWRGAAPIQRAIMAGDHVSGVCLMKLEQGLDSGPVYSSTQVVIGPDENAGSLHDRLSQAGAELLARDLAGIIDRQIAPVPQPDSGVTLAPKIGNQEALLDWSQPAQVLWLKIRALSPAPGAFTFINGKRLKIFRAVPRDTPPSPAQQPRLPGRTVALDPRSIGVYCGTGMLALEEVQLDGKKRMGISDFARGAALTSGTVLGGL